MRIALTIGTFDLLHEGHRELFGDCRMLVGDGTVVVGVNTDRFVASYKDSSHEPEQTRLSHVRDEPDVDAAVLHDGETAEFITMVRPDYLVVGTDWLAKDYLGQLGVTESFFATLGISLVYSPRTTGESSTARRQAL
jgi:cytidyltransferase-like protein